MLMLDSFTLSVTMQSVNLMNVAAPFGPTKKNMGCSIFVEAQLKILLGLSYKIFYGHNLYRGVAGMSDPNKQYNRRNCNSRTVKITFFRTGKIILPSLGKLFGLIYFPKVLPTRMTVR
jgi:hypothetical protein